MGQQKTRFKNKLLSLTAVAIVLVMLSSMIPIVTFAANTPLKESKKDDIEVFLDPRFEETRVGNATYEAGNLAALFTKDYWILGGDWTDSRKIKHSMKFSELYNNGSWICEIAGIDLGAGELNLGTPESPISVPGFYAARNDLSWNVEDNGSVSGWEEYRGTCNIIWVDDNPTLKALAESGDATIEFRGRLHGQYDYDNAIRIMITIYNEGSDGNGRVPRWQKRCVDYSGSVGTSASNNK